MTYIKTTSVSVSSRGWSRVFFCLPFHSQFSSHFFEAEPPEGDKDRRELRLFQQDELKKNKNETITNPPCALSDRGDGHRSYMSYAPVIALRH